VVPAKARVNVVIAVLTLTTALCALLGTGFARRYALTHAILDIPNERSSHSVPTPRGGGVALVVAILLSLVLATLLGLTAWRLLMAIGGGGIAVATVGWLDDRRHVPAYIRATVHFLAAGWALVWLGGLYSIDIGTRDLPLGPMGTVLAAFAIVWLINLYNFMDGIDGIAASEAVSVAGAGALLGLLNGGSAPVALLAALIASASAGFLYWNWTPARIFMGDVGSGFLGFAFGVLAVASEKAGSLSALAWTLLLGAFAFDATVTLIRRMAKGEQWYSAHRSHAYQRAVESGFSHLQVTSAFIAINVVLAAAVLVTILVQGMPAHLAVATALLILVVVYLWVEQRCPMWPRRVRSRSPNRAAARPVE
jgi:Fuc2NAc and GlcNAc transferase